MNLDTPVSAIGRVGKTTAGRLKKIGIETACDLIFYYPFRYDDFSQIIAIDKLQPGMITTVRGRVDILANRRSPRQRKILTEGVVSDATGEVKVIWFNQPWIIKNIKAGDEVYLSGKVMGDLFNVYFNSPSYEKVSAFSAHTARLVPIYPLTEGLTQKQLRFLVKLCLPLAGKVADFLPPEIIKKEKLFDLPRALKEIHFPQNKTFLVHAKKRLAFDELFLIQLWSQLARKNREQQAAAAIKFFERKTRNFVQSLDFTLTSDQKKTAWEILQDLQKSQPMNRLLEGEVGSGKTVVAAIAIYNVFLNKCQSVFMAPTEILARQHFNTLSKLFSRWAKDEVKIGLLTHSQRFIGKEKVSKKEFLDNCRQRKIDVVVGTHTLIQNELAFKKLALVIIDEQHRFGVEQRQMLVQESPDAPPKAEVGIPTSPTNVGERRDKIIPHFLSLTATPIPRTLALTIYGNLDLSVIREMPKGRKPVLTKIVPPEKRQLAYNFIASQIKAGRQIFVVCPLIDFSDKLGVRSVKQEFKKLNEEVFPHLSIGLLHGRLKPQTKEEAINNFAENKTNILVSTSVVEVGVDIPNATVMMIEGAQRFGLAQLHQFRGRVGRREHQSYCFLFSDSSDLETVKRLQALVDCQDGFALAQKDLELRGAGQLFGYEQSGFADLKIANLNDLEFIKKTRLAAAEFAEKSDLANFPELKEKLDSLGFVKHLE